MLTGDGNQFVEKDGRIYHYLKARWDHLLTRMLVRARETTWRRSRQGKTWFYACSCKKIRIEHRISFYTYMINKRMVGIAKNCLNTLTELKMLAYDEKAEDDKVKLVKQNDHTWDANMYALTPHIGRYYNYDLIN